MIQQFDKIQLFKKCMHFVWVFYFKTGQYFSEDHRAIQVGMHHSKPRPLSSLKRGHTRLPRALTSQLLKTCKERRYHNLSGQWWKYFPLHAAWIPPFSIFACCPSAMHHCEETGSIFLVTSSHVLRSLQASHHLPKLLLPPDWTSPKSPSSPHMAHAASHTITDCTGHHTMNSSQFETLRDL